MATHSSVLAWRIPGTGEPGGLPSMGSHRVRHDWSNLALAAAAVRVQWEKQNQHEIDIKRFLAYGIVGSGEVSLKSIKPTVRAWAEAEVPQEEFPFLQGGLVLLLKISTDGMGPFILSRISSPWLKLNWSWTLKESTKDHNTHITDKITTKCMFQALS